MQQGNKEYITEMLSMSDDLTNDSPESSQICQFFAGSHILVTGATGFLGKLLVEKLLRCCPDIATLSMLMRPKKGKSSEERFKDHFNDVLYEKLKLQRPDFQSKLVIIEGDIKHEDLALSEESRKSLLKTNVIFHTAATVRFDETLRDATYINVRGTKLLLEFAKQMPDLKSFVHVSTAFSYCVLKQIEEKHYPSPIEADRMIALTEILDDEKLDIIKSKLLGKWPNTYAFTKAIAESVVREYSRGIPICIIRPSIIISTANEPTTGWTNNLYGATGAVVGAAIGLLRTLHCSKEKIADIIPADYVISCIVAAAWDTGVNGKIQADIADSDSGIEISDIERIPIYNVVSSCERPIRWGEFMKLNEIFGKENPSTKVIWYYWFSLDRSYMVHIFNRTVFHLLPAVIVDAVAICLGRKPILMNAYRKIHKFSGVISYFATQEWKFKNDKCVKLLNKLNSVDRTMFNFDLTTLDWEEFFYYHIRGLRIFIVNDPMETLDEGRKKYKKLEIAHYSLITIGYLMLAWFVIMFLLYLWSFCPWAN